MTRRIDRDAWLALSPAAQAQAIADWRADVAERGARVPPGKSKPRRYDQAAVLELYADTVGWDPRFGAVTGDDLRTAIDQLLAEGQKLGPAGPWPESQARRLVDRLQGIVRQRQPQYRVTSSDDGALLLLVFDAEGGLDNFDPAVETFRRMAKARLGNRVLTEARLDRVRGASVEAAAVRQGVTPRTLQRRRAQIRDRGGFDPDTLLRPNET